MFVDFAYIVIQSKFYLYCPMKTTTQRLLIVSALPLLLTIVSMTVFAQVVPRGDTTGG